MIYIKPSLTNTTEAKLLYLMGSTWHNQCMFDLETLNDNFSTLLNKQGIETYTFNNFGINPQPETDFVGSKHVDNVNLAKEIIKKYNIDYVMGYSYGCKVVSSLVNECNIQGMILLDPLTDIKIKFKFVNDNDKASVNKTDIRDALTQFDSTMSPDVCDLYLQALCAEESFTVAAYPRSPWALWNVDWKEFCDGQRHNLKLFFTKNTTAEFRSMFPDNMVTYYPDASHWILLEESRRDLALEIKKFIDYINKKNS